MVSLNLDDHQIPYSDSPVADSESEAPSLSLNLEIGPHNSDNHFYFPYGRITSNRGSMFDTDEDMSAKDTPKANQLSSDRSNLFIPERDKIISYEVISPSSEAGKYGQFLSRQVSGFEASSSDESERPTVIQGVSISTPELIEDYFPGRKRLSQTQELSRTIALEQELELLRRRLEENTSELHKVQKVLDKKYKDKETNTFDEDEELTICNEINELRKECLRYERQNEELRQELQYSAQDLSESELTNRQLSRDYSYLQEKIEAYEEEMRRCIRLMSEMLGTDSAYAFDESDDLHHLSNFLSSKVEIAKSRLSRLKTKQELSNSEVKRLQAENEKYRKLIKTLANEHAETTASLKQQVKSYELKVLKLEKQVTGDKIEPKRDLFPARPFKASASIRIPAQAELETYIEKFKEASDHKSSRSVVSSSPDSLRSRQDDPFNKSISLNDSTREPSLISKHTKIISFTDELEGDKGQPKPVIKPNSISPDRKKTAVTPKQASKYMINARGALPRYQSIKSNYKRLQK